MRQGREEKKGPFRAPHLNEETVASFEENECRVRMGGGGGEAFLKLFFSLNILYSFLHLVVSLHYCAVRRFLVLLLLTVGQPN